MQVSILPPCDCKSHVLPNELNPHKIMHFLRTNSKDDVLRAAQGSINGGYRYRSCYLVYAEDALLPCELNPQ